MRARLSATAAPNPTRAARAGASLRAAHPSPSRRRFAMLSTLSAIAGDIDWKLLGQALVDVAGAIIGALL